MKEAAARIAALRAGGGMKEGRGGEGGGTARTQGSATAPARSAGRRAKKDEPNTTAKKRVRRRLPRVAEEEEEVEETEVTGGSSHSWGPAAPAPHAPPLSVGDDGPAEEFLEDEEDPGAPGGAAASGVEVMGDLVCGTCEEPGEEEEEFGARRAKGRRLPGRGPTVREREEHNLTHLPYRSWCPACVAGRGRGPEHTAAHNEGDDKPPTVSLDFWYPAAGAEGGGDDDGEGEREDAAEREEEEDTGEAAGAEKALDEFPALVLWEASIRGLAASVLPSKAVGAEEGYGTNFAITVIDHDWGLAGEAITLRGDGERACEALRKAVARGRAGRTAPETTARGDHQANGAAEQAVRTARAQARTHTAALAAKLGLVDLPANSPILPWAVRHGAWC